MPAYTDEHGWHRQTPEERLIDFGVSETELAKIPSGSDGNKFTIVLIPDGTDYNHYGGYRISYRPEPTEDDPGKMVLNELERSIHYTATDTLTRFEAKGLRAYVHLSHTPQDIIANGEVHVENRTVIFVRLNKYDPPKAGSSRSVDLAINYSDANTLMDDLLRWVLSRFN